MYQPNRQPSPTRTLVRLVLRLFLHLLLTQLAALLDRAARRTRSGEAAQTVTVATVQESRPRLTLVSEAEPHPAPGDDEPAEPTAPAAPAAPSAPERPRLVPVPPPSAPRVRPYLASSAQHRRRVELALALDGIDIGPDVIHGHRVGTPPVVMGHRFGGLPVAPVKAAA